VVSKKKSGDSRGKKVTNRNIVIGVIIVVLLLVLGIKIGGYGVTGNAVDVDYEDEFGNPIGVGNFVDDSNVCEGGCDTGYICKDSYCQWDQCLSYTEDGNYCTDEYGDTGTCSPYYCDTSPSFDESFAAFSFDIVVDWVISLFTSDAAWATWGMSCEDDSECISGNCDMSDPNNPYCIGLDDDCYVDDFSGDYESDETSCKDLGIDGECSAGWCDTCAPLNCVEGIQYCSFDENNNPSCAELCEGGCDTGYICNYGYCQWDECIDPNDEGTACDIEYGGSGTCSGEICTWFDPCQPDINSGACTDYYGVAGECQWGSCNWVDSCYIEPDINGNYPDIYPNEGNLCNDYYGISGTCMAGWCDTLDGCGGCPIGQICGTTGDFKGTPICVVDEFFDDDEGICNFNTICDVSMGESMFNCADCTSCTTGKYFKKTSNIIDPNTGQYFMDINPNIPPNNLPNTGCDYEFPFCINSDSVPTVKTCAACVYNDQFIDPSVVKDTVDFGCDIGTPVCIINGADPSLNYCSTCINDKNNKRDWGCTDESPHCIDDGGMVSCFSTCDGRNKDGTTGNDHCEGRVNQDGDPMTCKTTKVGNVYYPECEPSLTFVFPPKID